MAYLHSISLSYSLTWNISFARYLLPCLIRSFIVFLVCTLCKSDERYHMILKFECLFHLSLYFSGAPIFRPMSQICPLQPSSMQYSIIQYMTSHFNQLSADDFSLMLMEARLLLCLLVVFCPRRSLPLAVISAASVLSFSTILEPQKDSLCPRKVAFKHVQCSISRQNYWRGTQSLESFNQFKADSTKLLIYCLAIFIRFISLLAIR